jgi:hypothetical protein
MTASALKTEKGCRKRRLMRRNVYTFLKHFGPEIQNNPFRKQASNFFMIGVKPKLTVNRSQKSENRGLSMAFSFSFVAASTLT